ncbi:hypothetical protein [Pectobacterium brasiliense]|uniref:hypothetical protein n=1 Tax=Pectobacterium brasiliense TaxID=180957 RepID=UPI001968BEF5|nr:hypothetical protein [Pectobacterium brasiliense]MBN3123224.1 hypothetical protein [Pectobacterium brasiliense]
MKQEQVKFEFLHCGARVVVYSSYITLAGRKILKQSMPTGIRLAVQQAKREEAQKESGKIADRAPLTRK